MGLLTKEVDMVLNSSNISYFENLGYEIPRYYNKQSCTYRVKRGTKIKVKCSDLTESSDAIVEIECDECHKILSLPYNAFTKYNRNGKYYCKSCVAKLFNGGENNYRWNKTLTDKERTRKRTYPEYSDFVQKVLARDSYTCKCCGAKNKNFEVHHLNGYNWFKEGRIDQRNAVTLCENCHSNFHIRYGRGNNTKEQYYEWLGIAEEKLDSYNGELPKFRPFICYETKEIFYSKNEFKEKIGKSPVQAINCCNRKTQETNRGVIRSVTAFGNHYFWLDEYRNMNENDFLDYFKWAKQKDKAHKGKNNYLSQKVICITTGDIFDCISDASKSYGVHGISNCCRGKYNYAGKLKDGTKLKWMYYKEYLESAAS